MKNLTMTQRTALIGMLLALALICSYVETLFPFYFGVPGIKLGLANIVVLMALYLLGPKEALGISILRIFLSGFLFGNMFSIIYSLAGGLLSFLLMFLLKRFTSLNMLTISITGGVAHNLGQLVMAAVIVENYNVFYYMAVLFAAGLVTGFLIGIVSREVVIRLKGVLPQG